MARAREARFGTPIVLQPLEAPLVAVRVVLFSSTEYAHAARAIKSNSSPRSIRSNAQWTREKPSEGLAI
jgi:hypothetical protein